MRNFTRLHSIIQPLLALAISCTSGTMAMGQTSADLYEAVRVEPACRGGFSSLETSFLGKRTQTGEVTYADSQGRRLVVAVTAVPLEERESQWSAISLTSLAVPLREEAPSGFSIGSQLRITEVGGRGGDGGYMVSARFENLIVRVSTRDRSDGRDLEVYEAVARYALAGAYGKTLKADGTVTIVGRETPSYRSPGGTVFVRLDDWARARGKELTWNRAAGRAAFDSGASVVALAAPTLKVGGQTRPFSGIVALKEGHWLIPLDAIERR